MKPLSNIRAFGLTDGVRLDAARRQLLLTWEELWVLYIGLGGTLGIDNMTTYLSGSGQVSRLEHNVLAHALNEQSIDSGQRHLVTYLDANS